MTLNKPKTAALYVDDPDVGQVWLVASPRTWPLMRQHCADRPALPLLRLHNTRVADHTSHQPQWEYLENPRRDGLIT